MDDVRDDRTGRFRPGMSGNPAGRPQMDPEVRAILEAAVPNAVRQLVRLVDCDDPRVSLAACNVIMDRLYGKPSVAIDAAIKTTTIGEAHLQALREIQARSEQRRLELMPTDKGN